MSLYQEAISKLQQQIQLINDLKSKRSTSPEFTSWHLRTANVIRHIFGESSRQKEEFFKISFRLPQISNATLEATIRDKYLHDLEEARLLLESFVEELGEGDNIAFIAKQRDDILIIERICNRFHRVARQLRSRRNDRATLVISDEYDVQDLFRALLNLEFDDIRDEEWTPSYAGSASRIDFLLKKEHIAIEIKKTRENLGDKQIRDQLIIDIAQYQTHPECNTLVCFVYDPDNFIHHQRAIENDLTGNHGKLNVIVIIAPQG